MANETTFKNAKIGDRVWSPHYGNGQVACNSEDHIHVNFAHGLNCRYNIEGSLWNRNPSSGP